MFIEIFCYILPPFCDAPKQYYYTLCDITATDCTGLHSSTLLHAIFISIANTQSPGNNISRPDPVFVRYLGELQVKRGEERKVSHSVTNTTIPHVGVIWTGIYFYISVVGIVFVRMNILQRGKLLMSDVSFHQPGQDSLFSCVCIY